MIMFIKEYSYNFWCSFICAFVYVIMLFHIPEYYLIGTVSAIVSGLFGLWNISRIYIHIKYIRFDEWYTEDDKYDIFELSKLGRNK